MSTILKPTKDLESLIEKTGQESTSNASTVTESNPAFYPKPEGGFLELDDLRVAIVRPTYGNMQASPENSLLSAIMTASNHGVKWDSNLSPDKLGWGHARNFATEAFYKDSTEADGMLWIDSDIIMPTWAVWKLLSNAAMGYDFISGVYFNRGNPFAPVIYEYRSGVDGFANMQSFPSNKIIKIDGCGMGFCYTSRKMMVAIHDHPNFVEKFGWFPDTRYQEGGRGEDFNFCMAARDAGFQAHADTSILLGHEGDPHVYSILDHIAAHQE